MTITEPNNEQFVRTWLEAYHLGESQNWVALQLGVSRQYVSRTAQRMRNVEVKLPPLKRYVPHHYQSATRRQAPRLNQIISEELKK